LLCRRGLFQGFRAAAAVDRPLHVDPRAPVVRHVGIEHLKLAVLQEAELVDVVRALVTGLRRHDGQVGGAPLVEHCAGGRLARAQLAEPVAVGGGARQRLVERHARG
jgi:hypothetical protein